MPLPKTQTIDELTQERNRYYRNLDERGLHSPPQEGYVHEIPQATWSDELQYERKQMLAARYPQRTPEDIVADPYSQPSLTNLSPELDYDRFFNTPSKWMREQTRDLLYKTGMSGHAVRNLNEGAWDIADMVMPPMWALRGGENLARHWTEGSYGQAAIDAAFLPLAALGIRSPTGTKLWKDIINKFVDKNRQASWRQLQKMEDRHYGLKRGRYEGGPETWIDEYGRPGGRLPQELPHLRQTEPSFSPVPEVKNPDLVEKLNAVIEQKIPRGRPTRGRLGRAKLSRAKEAFGRMYNTKWNPEEYDAGVVMVEQGEDPIAVASMLDDLIK